MPIYFPYLKATSFCSTTHTTLYQNKVVGETFQRFIMGEQTEIQMTRVTLRIMMETGHKFLHVSTQTARCPLFTGSAYRHCHLASKEHHSFTVAIKRNPRRRGRDKTRPDRAWPTVSHASLLARHWEFSRSRGWRKGNKTCCAVGDMQRT